jgi:lipopolysaccharide export system permease protein
MKSYNATNDIGYKFSMEHFDESGTLQSKLMSDYVKWDSTNNKWTIRNYYIREINGLEEKIITGTSIDTALNMKPEEFKRIENFTETMNIHELNNYISEQRMQGADVISLLIDKYSRVAYPFSTFILTLIGVSLSSRKIRGGIGMHIGFGLLLSFSYILFMRFSTMFAVNGTMNPLFAVWLPNLIYAIISLFLYRLAPK